MPSSFVVPRPLEFTDGKTHESFVIGAGTYSRWYQNKFSYYYRQEGTLIRQKTKNGAWQEFPGGLELSNRLDIIGVYRLQTLAEASHGKGEVAHLAAWEAGDKDGYYRTWLVNLPREYYPDLGFPKYQLPGTER